MRRTFFFLLLLLGVGAGLGFYVEMKRASALSAQLDEARGRLKFVEEQLAAKTEAVRQTDEKSKVLVAESEGLREKLKAAHAAAASPGEAVPSVERKTPDVAARMSKMMKDPAFMKMMKPQLEAQMRKTYADLFKKLNLPPDTQEKFFDLMTEHSLAAMEMGSSVYSGDKEKLKQAADDFGTKMGDRDRQIGELLGSDGLAQVKDYEKTIADRMALDQLRGQFKGADALQSQQADAILQIMVEERGKGPPVKLADQGDPAGVMKELGSPEALERFEASQTDLNTRVANRAMSVLTPSQFKQFQDFQKQQMETQKFGLKMATQLLSPQESGTGEK